jgi:hypothetical protein
MKSYYAMALIFCHCSDLRAKHPECYKGLRSAWETHFGTELTLENMGKPPRVGQYAYTDEEKEWCTQTLRFFNAGGSARSVRPAAPEPGPAVGLRKSSRVVQLVVNKVKEAAKVAKGNLKGKAAPKAIAKDAGGDGGGAR